MIAGENSPCTFNPLRCAWGKEKYNYSIENLDNNTDSMKDKDYSLSARLRQTFDFLVMKVYSVVYR